MPAAAKIGEPRHLRHGAMRPECEPGCHRGTQRNQASTAWSTCDSSERSTLVGPWWGLSCLQLRARLDDALVFDKVGLVLSDALRTRVRCPLAEPHRHLAADQECRKTRE